jgi:integrase
VPRIAKELSAYQVRRLKRPGLHAVGGVNGLYLNVKAIAGRSWILRVTIDRKVRELGLGSFPTVSLEQARDRARTIRQQVWDGIDPIAARRAAQDAWRAAEAKRLTFDEAADACWRARAAEFKNAKHKAQFKATLDTYASPKIGALNVADIELAHVLQVLEPIWQTKTETASRLRGRMEKVLAWATVNKFRQGENPARWSGNLDQALPKPSKIRTVVHHRALPWQDAGAFMADLRKRDGISARALEFLILTAARSGEVRGATWAEIDLQAKLWTIPAARMRAGKVHKVPLSAPAVALLKALPRFPGVRFVFPSPRRGQLSDMALSAVLRRMEVDAVPHGFRSTFKDWARSSTANPDEVSELALAHVSTDATRAAYARDELLPQRARLMRDWAAYLAKPAGKAAVTPIGKRR